MLSECVQNAQRILMYICLFALVCIFFGVIAYKLSEIWEREFKARWKGLDGLSRFVVCAGIAAAVMYGGSKPMYNNPPQVGADEGIKLWFVDVKYDTNTLHSTIQVVWTNGFDAASINTPLAFRDASSNDWTIINYPDDARVYSVGYSNILEFTMSSTTNDFSKHTHWWFGTDYPATEIIVTSDDLRISEFKHTSEYVDVSITISEELQTIFDTIGADSYFMIQFSDDNGKTWVDVAQTRNMYIRIPGFWYGKDRIWRVIYVYQPGD